MSVICGGNLRSSSLQSDSWPFHFKTNYSFSFFNLRFTSLDLEVSDHRDKVLFECATKVHGNINVYLMLTAISYELVDL